MSLFRFLSRAVASAVGLAALMGPAPGLGAPVPEVQERVLERSRPWQGTLAAEQLHAWRVAVEPGQWIEVEIITAPPGLHVRLLDEQGREVLSRGQDSGASTVAWVSTAAGRWTLEVSSPASTDYAIWLPVVREASEHDREKWQRDLLETELLRYLEAGDAEGTARALPRLLAALRKELAGDPVALASHLENLATRLTLACDGPAAADLLEEARLLRERAQGADHLELAANLELLAEVRAFLGEWNLREAAERQALDIRLRHFAGRQTAESYRGLGVLYYDEGRFGEAVEAFDQALGYFEREREPSRADLAVVHGSLAEVQRARGDFNEARAGFTRAVDEARSEQESSPEIYALVLSNRAGLKRDEGRYAEAKSDLRQARDIFARLTDYPADLATVTLNLAEISRMQGDYGQADEGYREALSLAEKALCPGHPDLLWFLNQYALSLAEQGKYEAAEPLYRRALSIEEQDLGPDHPAVAQSLHDLAATLGDLGRFAEAETLSRRALAIRRKVFGADHPEVAASLVQRARLAFQSSREASDAALDTVAGALRILERTRVYPDQAIEAYGLRAELLRRRGDMAEARRALAQALDLIDAERLRTGGGDRTRSQFMRRYLREFLRMVAWQVDAGDVGAALAFTERYRARVLQDQLAAYGVDLFGRAQGRLAVLERRRTEMGARIAELHSQLAFARSRSDTKEDRRARILSLEASLDDAYRAYETILEEAKNDNPRWRSLDGRTVGLPEIRSLVPEDGLLLIYQIGDDRSFLFLVPPAGPPEAHALEVPAAAAALLGVPPGPLTAEAAGAVFAFGEGKTGASPSRTAASPDPSRLLHAMWQILIPAGVWPRVAAASEVVLVPDRWLHHLPFEQLVVDAGSGSGEPSYWLDAGPPIRYAPSASSLYALGQRGEIAGDAGVPSVLSVSDPVYDPADLGTDAGGGGAREGGRPAAERPLDRLPRTADETRAIQEVFREAYGTAGADVLVLSRGQATEARIRSALGGKRFLHFGTHGVVDEGRGELFTGLACAPPGPEPWVPEDDGFLQLFEIYDLNLSAELAVLSACETHAGPAVEGEGVFALSRGFLAAGARRVVGSLWKVEEESTAALMESFFRSVLSAYRMGRPIRYAEALRDAKRQVRQRPEWSSPFFWAPFLLTGVE
jgi:CHAT domain-containing protein/tetratricopeptide (TPR) repeat protein